MKAAIRVHRDYVAVLFDEGKQDWEIYSPVCELARAGKIDERIEREFFAALVAQLELTLKAAGYTLWATEYRN